MVTRTRTRWEALSHAMRPIAAGHSQRGLDRQPARREAQRSVQLGILGFIRWTTALGKRPDQVRLYLGLSPRIVMDWARRRQMGRLTTRPRGRPVEPLDVQIRVEIDGLLVATGPDVGLRVLRQHIPDVPKADLAPRLWDFRENLVEPTHSTIHCLDWPIVGQVWAMDYTQPQRPLEGVYGATLSVRDPASGQELLALPCQEATEQATADSLESLFTEHGRPLVIKADNGSHFTGSRARELLREHEVNLLLSPPCYPPVQCGHRGRNRLNQDPRPPSSRTRWTSRRLDRCRRGRGPADEQSSRTTSWKRL